MPTLLPTVENWIDGTDWVLTELTHEYLQSTNLVGVAGGPPQLMLGMIEENISIEFAAVGMRHDTPLIPPSVLISEGYAGSRTLLVRNMQLEYISKEVDHGLHGGLIGIHNQEGITTLKITGVLTL